MIMVKYPSVHFLLVTIFLNLTACTPAKLVVYETPSKEKLALSLLITEKLPRHYVGTCPSFVGLANFSEIIPRLNRERLSGKYVSGELKINGIKIIDTKRAMKIDEILSMYKINIVAKPGDLIFGGKLVCSSYWFDEIVNIEGFISIDSKVVALLISEGELFYGDISDDLLKIKAYLLSGPGMPVTSIKLLLISIDEIRRKGKE